MEFKFTEQTPSFEGVFLYIYARKLKSIV